MNNLRSIPIPDSSRIEWYRAIENVNLSLARAFTELTNQFQEISALKAEVSNLKALLDGFKDAVN